MPGRADRRSPIGIRVGEQPWVNARGLGCSRTHILGATLLCICGTRALGGRERGRTPRRAEQTRSGEKVCSLRLFGERPRLLYSITLLYTPMTRVATPHPHAALWRGKSSAGAWGIAPRSIQAHAHSALCPSSLSRDTPASTAQPSLRKQNTM